MDRDEPRIELDWRDAGGPVDSRENIIGDAKAVTVTCD
jgi:hypothetical protein